MHCSICEKECGIKNIAILNCNHTFHLSCFLKNVEQYSVNCPMCNQDTGMLCDLGDDRNTAMNAELVARCRKRQLQPSKNKTIFARINDVLSPLTPKIDTFLDNVIHNKKLSIIKMNGFCPEDAIRERIQWSILSKTYPTDELINFGFTWDHMIKLGIRPPEISKFTWTQQSHILKLNAAKMLQMHMTISELASLRYTTHQLLELKFDWQTLTNMGANVETWNMFKFEIKDLKRYWKPTMSQWVSGGFYDKERLQRSGWPIDEALETLPNMTQRCSGRTLRLAF
tara:strand:- start:149 stop:1000 length:852 start_codon:yes stop_codon:yes gene_type:complete